MKLSEQLKSSWNIFDALEAVKNWRALLVLLGGMAVACLFLVAGAATEKFLLFFFTLLIAAAVLVYTWNTVGIMLRDNAEIGRKASLSQALTRSFTSGHRLALLIIVCLAAYILASVALMALLLPGKIPGIGTSFTFIMTPVATLVLGVVWFLCTFWLLPLGSASLWEGETLERALSNLVAIARSNFLSVVVREALLGVLAFLTGGIILVAMGIGGVTTASLEGALGLRLPTLEVAGSLSGAGNAMSSSADAEAQREAIAAFLMANGAPGGNDRRVVADLMTPGGADRGMAQMPQNGGMNMGRLMGGFGGASLAGGLNHFAAAGIGSLLLLILVSLIPTLVLARGLILIYRDAVGGCASALGPAGLRPQAPASVAAAEPVVSPRLCAHCGGELADDDVFCPNCGQKRA